MTGIDRVWVIVPVHDEQALLLRCLQAIRRAGVVALDAGLRCDVVVALDSCSDGSAQIVDDVTSRCPSVRSIRGAWRSVGAARSAACATAVAGSAGTPTDRVWLAVTDADSEVREDWLTTHARLARAGADCVTGTVSADGWDGWPTTLAARYRAAYAGEPRTHPVHAGTSPEAPHDHVHGANLGVRASAYRAVRGFDHVTCHEDVRLVAALRRAGHHVVPTRDSPVSTSTRAHNRVPGGFSGYLHALGRPLRPAAACAVPEAT